MPARTCRLGEDRARPRGARDGGLTWPLPQQSRGREGGGPRGLEVIGRNLGFAQRRQEGFEEAGRVLWMGDQRPWGGGSWELAGVCSGSLRSTG